MPIPFHLEVRSGTESTGGITSILLPRSFHGLLILQGVASRIRISDAMVAQLTKLGEEPNETRYFLGDLINRKEPSDKCLVTATRSPFGSSVGFVDLDK